MSSRRPIRGPSKFGSDHWPDPLPSEPLGGIKFDPQRVSELAAKAAHDCPREVAHGEPIRVLVIGDDPNDLRLVNNRLTQIPVKRFTIETVDRLDDVEEAGLRFCPHVAVMTGWPSTFLDAGLMETLPRIMSTLPYTKMIVVTDGSPDQKRYAKGIGAKGVISRNALGDYRLLSEMVTQHALKK